MNNKTKHALAQELYELDVKKQEIVAREKEIEKMLDPVMINNEPISVDRGKHYLLKTVAETPVLIDNLRILKRIGITAFLTIAKASVEKLRALVGEIEFPKFVKGYKQGTPGFKFYEYKAEKKTKAA